MPVDLMGLWAREQVCVLPPRLPKLPMPRTLSQPHQHSRCEVLGGHLVEGAWRPFLCLLTSRRLGAQQREPKLPERPPAATVQLRLQGRWPELLPQWAWETKESPQGECRPESAELGEE